MADRLGQGGVEQVVACALDLHDDGMVEEAVEEGRGDDGVAEHLAPFGEAAVGGQDDGAALVAGVTPTDKLSGLVPAT